MIQTTFYAFWASLLTALWLNQSTWTALLVSSAIGPLTACLRAASKWVGGWRQRRRLTDATSIIHGGCPVCHRTGSIEVTSGSVLTCAGCTTHYHVDDDGLVTRMKRCGANSKPVHDSEAG